MDSSALVKRYIVEAASPWVVDLLAPSAGNSIHISVITGAEIVAALTRRQRGGHLTADQAAQIIAEFTDDWTLSYELVRADRNIVNRAMELARRHGLRGYDSVQLASALEVSGAAQEAQADFTLVSADDEINAAATAEGLAVENPNQHP